MTWVFYFSAGEMCVTNESPRAARSELETTVHNVSAGAAGQAAELQQTHAGHGKEKKQRKLNYFSSTLTATLTAPQKLVK